MHLQGSRRVAVVDGMAASKYAEALMYMSCMLNKCKCRQVICSSKGLLHATEVGWLRDSCLLCRPNRCTCMQWGLTA